MAAYRIALSLKGKTVKGIRELEQEDVDTTWEMFYAAAVQVYSLQKILAFEVVKISSFSDDYRQWKVFLAFGRYWALVKLSTSSPNC